MFNSTITAEILRISKASSSYNVFVRSVNILIKRMTKQGAILKTLSYSLKKMLNKHSEIKTKFHTENNIIQRDILTV